MYCIASKTQIDELTEELTAEKEITVQQKKEIDSQEMKHAQGLKAINERNAELSREQKALN